MVEHKKMANGITINPVSRGHHSEKHQWLLMIGDKMKHIVFSGGSTAKSNLYKIPHTKVKVNILSFYTEKTMRIWGNIEKGKNSHAYCATCPQ